MQARTKKIAALVALPTLLAGWAAFRPELLFIDSTVSEKAPLASSDSMIVAKGGFLSFAHETTGTAQIWKVGGKSVLRLSDFKTSNGPDVHVYLVRGSDPKVINQGSFLDLGAIKGNIGDQNYELPYGTSLDDYQSVTIWCKRFSVGFGGAALSQKRALRVQSQPMLSLAAFGPEITVTGGNFTAEVKGTKGRAEIIEREGKRYVRLKGTSTGTTKSVQVFLVKKETVGPGADITKFDRVGLGTLNPGTVQEFPISKDLDVWLYRSVTLWDSDAKRPLGSAALRSAQEKHNLTLNFA